MTGAPLPYVWDGAAVHPLPAFAKAASASFSIGEVVALAPAELRSSPSHRHYFAGVREAWVNLPERPVASPPRRICALSYRLFPCQALTYCAQIAKRLDLPPAATFWGTSK
jgi:hypothetical protein